MNYRIFMAIGLAAALSGCSPRVTTSARPGESLPRGAKVAVLPFENLSGRENASEKITEYLILALQRHPEIQTVEFGQVYEQMRRFRIRSSTLLTNDQIDSLKAGLGVAYLVTGTVLEYTETDNNYLGKVPQISVNMRMIDCASKNALWTGVINARGDQHEVVFGIGAVRSREELAHDAVEQAADKIAVMFTK
jgi:TolB-like protein